MKRRLVILFALLLVPKLWAAESIEVIDSKIKLESTIADQIRSDLKTLLGEGNFFVSVDAQIVREEAKEVVQEESASVTSSKGGETAGELPGFSQYALPGGGGQSAQKKVFKVSQMDKLARLAIHIVIAETLSGDVEELVKKYLNNKWVKAAPDITEVTVTRVAPTVLKPIVPSPGLKLEEVASRVRDFIRTPWAGLAGVVLVLGLLFLLIRPSKEGKGAGTVTVVGNNKGEKEEKAPEASAHLAELKKGFIDEIAEEPIYARGFLSSLDPERKEHLLSAFKDSAARDLLKHLMGGDVVEGTHFKGVVDPSQNGAVFFPELANDFKGYKKIREQQKNSPLSFLRDLLPSEIVSLLGAHPTDVWATALSVLSNDSIEAVLALIPPETRMELANRLAQASTTMAKPTEDVDRILRPLYDTMSTNLLVPSHSSAEILNVMLETSDDSPMIAEKILSQREDLKPLLGKYLFGFDRLFNLDGTALSKILADVDNETIIAALQGLDKKGEDQFMKVLSSERRAVLKHMKPTVLSQITESDVKKARGQMIRKARALTPL